MKHLKKYINFFLICLKFEIILKIALKKYVKFLKMIIIKRKISKLILKWKKNQNPLKKNQKNLNQKLKKKTLKLSRFANYL